MLFNLPKKKDQKTKKQTNKKPQYKHIIGNLENKGKYKEKSPLIPHCTTQKHTLLPGVYSYNLMSVHS